MQISSTRIQPQSPYLATPSVGRELAAAQDSFTLSSSDSLGNRVGRGAVAGVLGAIPVVGAFSSFGVGMGAGWDANSAAGTYAGLSAAGGNVLGTLTLAGGALFGSETAKQIGIGLLGASGLTAGITAAVVDF
jgi:hypothetical protein